MSKLKNAKNFLKKSWRFGMMIPFTNLILTFGNKYFSQSFLQKISDNRNRKIERDILKIIGGVPSVSVPKNATKSDKLWVLWMQGEDKMPSIPRMCYASLKKYAGTHEIVFLSEKNLHEYVDIPERILMLHKKGNITFAQLSDIIRITLLHTYGGMWIDSTMLFTAPIDDNIFDMPVFTVKTQPFGTFVSKCRWCGFALATQLNSTLPHLLYEMIMRYWEKEDLLIDYFLIDCLIDIAYQHNDIVRNEIEAVPYNNEELHGMAARLCTQFNEIEYKRLTAETSMFKLSWKAYSEAELESNKGNYYHKLLELHGGECSESHE